jgi:hypothetical protein
MTKNKSTSTTGRSLGWVIRDIETGQYINRNENYTFTRKLSNAKVFNSRSIARDLRSIGRETVDKVAVERNAPVKVLANHGG